MLACGSMWSFLSWRAPALAGAAPCPVRATLFYAPYARNTAHLLSKWQSMCARVAEGRSAGSVLLGAEDCSRPGYEGDVDQGLGLLPAVLVLSGGVRTTR